MSYPETGKSYRFKDISKIAATSLVLTIVIVVLLVLGWDSLQESARIIFHQSISNRLEKEIDTKFFQMYPEYAEKLAVNKEISMLAQGRAEPNNPEVMIILQTAKQISGASIVYVMDSKGTVVGCSSFDPGKSLLGDNYSFRPYFIQAMKGKSTAYPALGVATNFRGIYFSTPIYAGTNSTPVGVVVIKSLLAPIDELLGQISEPVALLSPDGIVFATNRKDWMYHSALPIKEETLDRVRKSRQFSDQRIAPLQTQLNKDTVEIDDIDYSVRRLPIKIRGWQIGTLASLKVNYAIPTQQLLVFWGGLAFLAMLSANTVVLMFSMSKRKKMELELRRTEEKYRSIFENAVEGIFRTTPTRQFIDANASLARILGYGSKEELISRIDNIAVQCFANADDFYNIEGNVDKAGQISGIEKRLLRKNGQIFWGSISLRTVRNPAGEILFYEGTLVDISERKDKENAERQKEIAELSTIAKNEFLANMSHEIRTPMNAILGLCHLMTATPLSSKQKDYQNKIYYSANSLLRLIDDILDFSKIEAGRLTIESVRFNFDDIFENLSILASTRIGDSPIEFLYDFAPDIPRKLEGDHYRIGQILTNLISNAVKFTQIGSIVVRVWVKEKTDNEVRLRFEVQDTGIGISSGKLESLFDPFIQADGSTTRQYGGTGLGLSICQKLCALMGGTIGVESELGKGSLFHFELPLKYIESPIVLAFHPKLQNLKVLLVDDSQTALLVLGNMLNSMGLKVVTAGSVTKALARFAQPDSDFDLILLDWRITGIDGIETARRIHENLGNKRPIIMMMIAYGQALMEQESSHEHLDGLLVKPFTPFQLSDAIIRGFEPRTSVTSPLLASVDQPFKIGQLEGKILLVEDNEINQQVSKELIEQMGLAVDAVDDGEKAVRYIEQQRPDLVLMDIQMPVMDGYEATRHIRDLPGMSDLPIYAMTANALTGDTEKSIQAGMDGHISKPVKPQELFHILSEHQQSSPRTQESPAVGKKDKASWVPPAKKPHGIDLLHGITQVGGNPDFYFKLLGGFISNHSNCVSELKAAMKESNFHDARRVAHTLNGVANTIGAYDLQQVAAELEVYIADGKLPPDELFRLFSQTCENLFTTLESLLSASGNPESVA